MNALFSLLAATLLQAPQEPPGFWERDALLGEIGGVRTTLEEHGVTFALAFTGEVLSNVSGGLEKDTGADLLLDWVIDADFEKAFGWSGATARLNPMWLAGDGLADDIGDLTLVSNVTGRGGVRLFEAWLQQAFAGTVSVRAGLLAADQEFAIATSGLLYYNSVFGGPVFLTPNVHWPLYPVGALGARLRLEIAEGAYVQGAVYDGDPGTEDFNRSGLRARLADHEGVFAIVEAGWTSGEELPTTLKAGWFHHTADFTDFATGATVPGPHGGYVVAERRIRRGLDAFIRLGYSEEDRSVVTFGVDAGLNFSGLLPGRPDDVLGLGAIYARIGRSFAASQPDHPLWCNETVFEATYKIVIAPWWSLQPDLQYILHTGGSTAIPNTVVVALRVDLLF